MRTLNSVIVHGFALIALIVFIGSDIWPGQFTDPTKTLAFCAVFIAYNAWLEAKRTERDEG